MSRYIDADTAMQIINNYQKTALQEEETQDAINAIKDIVSSICPTADVQETKYGQWKYPFDNSDVNKCSNCGFCVQDKINNVHITFVYCPNCGARMDGENEKR